MVDGPGRARGALGAARRKLDMWREEPLYRATLRARLDRPRNQRRFARFGPGAALIRPQWVYGAHKIALGADVVVLPGAWLSAERVTWDREEPAIVIGDRTMMRFGLTLSATAGIDIGDDVVFGAQCSVIDSDHTWRAGHDNVLFNPVEALPIVIGSGTWLGDRVTVLRGAKIGRRCAIGAHSVVRGEIPDGSIAVGAPARVVGRSEDL